MLHHEHLTNSELLHRALYIMISVAATDNELAPEELTVIVRKADFFELFQLPITLEKLNDIVAEYEADGPKERRIKLMKAVGEICQMTEAKDALLADLENIIDADGKVCQAELELFRCVRNAAQ